MKRSNANEPVKEEERLVEVIPPYRLGEIEVEKIITNGEKDSFCRTVEKSVKRLGVIENVVLVNEGDQYRIAAGVRRVMAAKQNDKKTVPAIVFQKGVPRAIVNMITLVENMARGPNPAREAQAIQEVMAAYEWTAKDLSDNLGIPVSHIRGRLQLLELVPELFLRLKNGEISVGVAKRLCKVPKDGQRRLAGETKLTSDKVEAALREEKLKDLIPDELFKMPTPAITGEELEKVQKQLRDFIRRCDDAKRAKIEQASALLEEVAHD